MEQFQSCVKSEEPELEQQLKVCAVPWPKNKWICPAGIMSFSEVHSGAAKLLSQKCPEICHHAKRAKTYLIRIML